MKWIIVVSLLLTLNAHAETNAGIFSKIEASCGYGNGNEVECKVKVTVNALNHPDYFEEVTHVVIVENQDCNKADYNDILFLSKLDYEGQSFDIMKTYTSDIETWYSACLFMEEELVESLPVFVQG